MSGVETKLTLIIRADLGMGRGKIAAQAAHAAVAAALASAGSADFRAWRRDGEPKVVLKVNGEEELYALAERACAAGLPVQVVHDAEPYAGRRGHADVLRDRPGRGEQDRRDHRRAVAALTAS